MCRLSGGCLHQITAWRTRPLPSPRPPSTALDRLRPPSTAFDRPRPPLISLTIIGSGTVAPSPTRTSAAYWVEAGDVRLLMDCGAGTLHRAASLGVPWHTVTHIALTHFHA